MELHKIIRLDDMPEILRAGRFEDESGNEAEIENGEFVVLGDLLDKERELYKVTKATNDSTGLIGVVCTPEVDYVKEGYHGVETFINKQGRPIRIAIFRDGFRFSITNADYTLNQEITVGNWKLKCIEIEKKRSFTYYVLQCVEKA